jgi:hypothetical protein
MTLEEAQQDPHIDRAMRINNAQGKLRKAIYILKKDLNANWLEYEIDLLEKALSELEGIKEL